MEQSMAKFVRQVFSGAPDYTTLTKAELRERYIKETGISELTKSKKKLFSDIVNKILVEFADAVISKSDENTGRKSENGGTTHNRSTESENSVKENGGNKVKTNKGGHSENGCYGTNSSDVNTSDDFGTDFKVTQSESSEESKSNFTMASSKAESKESSRKRRLGTEEEIANVFDSLDTSGSDSDALVIMEEPEEDVHETDVKNSSKEKEKINGSSLKQGSSSSKNESMSGDSSDDFKSSTRLSKKTKNLAKSDSPGLYNQIGNESDTEDDQPLSSVASDKKASAPRKRKTSNSSQLGKPKKVKTYASVESSSESESKPSRKSSRKASIASGSRTKKCVDFSSSSDEDDGSDFKKGDNTEEKKQERSKASLCSNDSSSDDESLSVLKIRERAKAAENGHKDGDSDEVSASLKSEKSGSSHMKNSDSEEKEESATESDSEEEEEESKEGSKGKTIKEGTNAKKNKETASRKVRKESKSSASTAKIERYKKYLHAAGIRVQSYSKLWESCKSAKTKADKLLELLHKEGLKGQPSLQKCKKLKKKIEKKKEIEELDVSNIIKTNEGRPKRSARSLYLANKPPSPKAEQEEPEPEEHFERLKDLVDSGSSSDEHQALYEGLGDPEQNSNVENVRDLLDSDDDERDGSKVVRKVAACVKGIIESDDSD